MKLLKLERQLITDLTLIKKKFEKMVEDMNINDIKIGMILQKKRSKERLVVIDTDLNGNDEYYSRLKVVPENICIENKGRIVTEKELNIDWIESFEFKNYEICEDTLDICFEKIYAFN